MPLHSIDLALTVGESGHRGGLGRGQNLEARRGFHNLVAVAHPANLLGSLAVEYLSAGTNLKFGGTVFTLTSCINAAAQGVRQSLETVANAKDWHPKLKDCWIELW